MSWFDIGDDGTLDDITNAIREAQQDGRIRGEICTVVSSIDNGYVKVDVQWSDPGADTIEFVTTTLEV